MQLKRIGTRLVVLLAALPAASTVHAQAQPYDVVIRNGRLVDGTGAPAYAADVGIRGDTVVAIGALGDVRTRLVIDAAGRVVAPGFIDIHTHARRGIFDIPTAENYVRQGVTTLMEGPDGGSPLPISHFLARLDSLPKSVNIGTFIGQGSVRAEVVGNTNRAATVDELEQMRRVVEQGMRDGAFGLSTGLFYVPGIFTPTEEVIELARVAGRLGGIHISHMRNEAAGVLASVRETIRIGEEGALPTQVTHHKVMGRGNWGASTQTLKLVDEARARGVDVTLDQYPYTASSTGISSALLPPWALEGGSEATRARLSDPEVRARVRSESAELIRLERGGGDPKNVVIARCDWDPALAGRDLGEVTRQRGLEPTVENAAETAIWITEQGGCQGIFHAIDEADLRRILQHPFTMIASDGEIPTFGERHPHPRSYGTFARVLARYVRDERLLTLEEAVRRMSALPAQRLGLRDRGMLRTGMRADVVIFDPATIQDHATFDRPHQYATGVSHVLVNGVVVFVDGGMTAARPGRVLFGPAHP